MVKKSMVMVLGQMVLPGLVFAWTYSATMDSYPSIGGGFSCVTRSAGILASETHSSAPQPTKVLHEHFKEGIADAKEAMHCPQALPSGTNEIYFHYYIKFGSNWLFHPTLDKHFYIYGYHPTSGRAVAGFIGSRARSTGKTELVYASASIFGEGFRYVNIGTAIDIKKDTWYKVDGWIKAGTPGGRNGQIKLWLNDTLQLSYAGVPILADYANYLAEASLTPVWGGNNGIIAPPGGMDRYWDNLIVSSNPISGATGTVTVEDKSPNAPNILSVQ